MFLCPDQEKAYLKAVDTGEVGEGKETERAKEVWQKGWSMFFNYIISLRSLFEYILSVFFCILKVGFYTSL